MVDTVTHFSTESVKICSSSVFDPTGPGLVVMRTTAPLVVIPVMDTPSLLETIFSTLEHHKLLTVCQIQWCSRAVNGQ